MKKINKTIVTVLSIVVFALSAGAVQAATSVAGGELKFDGGQTGTYVYSEIWDVDTKNDKKYKVQAIVKVCGNTTKTEFLDDRAYESEPRSFWCNETSHYDYYAR